MNSYDEGIERKKERLNLYLQAEQAILSGQSYEVEGLKLTRADLKTVEDMIEALERAIYVADIDNRRKRFRVIIPRESW